nr:hypothetical protein [uncultured Holophaga sp.]
MQKTNPNTGISKTPIQALPPGHLAEPGKFIYANQKLVRHLTLHDSRAFRDFALHLDRLMQRAILQNQPDIRFTIKEIADQARVSYASAKRAMACFKARGWVESKGRIGIVVTWPQRYVLEAHKEPLGAPDEPSRDQDEPAHKEEKNTLREGVQDTHSRQRLEDPSRGLQPSGPGGWHGEFRERENLTAISLHPNSEPPLAKRAVALLVEAGANRAGAVAAVNKAAQEGRLSIEHVQQIVAATLAKKHRLKNPGGMMCNALRCRGAGEGLLRESKQRKPPQEHVVQSEASAPSWSMLPTHISLLLGMASMSLEPDELKLMIAQKRFTPEQVRDFATRYPRYSHFADWLGPLGLSKPDHQ